MRNPPDWRGLVPHAGAMQLIDTVCDWDDACIDARTGSHRDPHNPLRSAGRLHAVVVCEYAGQVMAIHGGLLARRDARCAAPGWIAAVRDLRLARQRLDDLPAALDIHARRLLGDARGCQYAFRVEHAAMLIAEGRLAIFNRTPHAR